MFIHEFYVSGELLPYVDWIRDSRVLIVPRGTRCLGHQEGNDVISIFMLFSFEYQYLYDLWVSES